MNFCIVPYSDDVINYGSGNKIVNADTGRADFKFKLPSGELIELTVEYKDGDWESNYEFPDGTVIEIEDYQPCDDDL